MLVTTLSALARTLYPWAARCLQGQITADAIALISLLLLGLATWVMLEAVQAWRRGSVEHL
jgi:hypothetical protein